MKVFKILGITITIVVVIAVIVCMQKPGAPEVVQETHETAYVASDTNTAAVFSYGPQTTDGDSLMPDGDESTMPENGEIPAPEDITLEQSGELVRGTEVERCNNIVLQDDREFVKVLAGDKEYYLPEENLAKSIQDVVLEKTRYVRTPATVYENPDGPEIAGFAPKGTELEIISYSELQDDGTVKKYRVRFGGGDESGGDESDDETTGYIYSKYLVTTQEEADAVYNENGEYDKAKKAKFRINLYGGKAKNLDYYPCEKPEIEGNPLCRDARTMYLTARAATDEKYFKLAKKSGVNAVVINVDGGGLAYKSPIAKELCPRAYKHAYTSVKKYQKAVARYNDAGIYTIGRIVAFNDKNYAKDHPKACIKTSGKSTGWVSAYNRGAWYYNVSLAIEAVDLMGFNEIQFDYVRFPERSYQMSKDGKTNFRNKYNEEKAQAIQNFCFYATDQIHEAGAYVSVDVFGECSSGYVTAYGQYWQAISNVVDVISSMPYTDHFGETDTWSNPGPIMKSWAKKAAKCQKQIPTPAIARTWITGYNTPHWDPQVDYDESMLRKQVKALYDNGLDGGFIPWHSSSNMSKYKEYKGIWSYGTEK